MSSRESVFMAETSMTKLEKVIVQYGNRILKGYLDSPAWNTLEELLSNAPSSSPQTFRIRRLDSDVVEVIPAQDLKAVFYVNSFEGNPSHKQLNFSTSAPIVHGIWVRLQFSDGEVMEGIVHNSLRYLIDPGFFLIPTDPGSNNKLAYIVKSSLVDHRVLGLRKL
jgi:hypothetical protein